MGPVCQPGVGLAPAAQPVDHAREDRDHRVDVTACRLGRPLERRRPRGRARARRPWRPGRAWPGPRRSSSWRRPTRTRPPGRAGTGARRWPGPRRSRAPCRARAARPIAVTHAPGRRPAPVARRVWEVRVYALVDLGQVARGRAQRARPGPRAGGDVDGPAAPAPLLPPPGTSASISTPRRTISAPAGLTGPPDLVGADRHEGGGRG